MGEQNCLISNMLASECLLLLIGVVGSMVASGVVSGDWFGSIVGFGWAHEIALSCMKLSAIDTIVAAIVVTVIALAVAHAIEFVASHTTSGRLSIIASRRGLNGEIPRIDSYAVFAGMCAAGFAEELLFRFVLVGGVTVLLGLFIPAKIAVIAAVVISTAVFVYAHEEYRDWYTLLGVRGDVPCDVHRVCGYRQLCGGRACPCGVRHHRYRNRGFAHGERGRLLLRRGSAKRDARYV